MPAIAKSHLLETEPWVVVEGAFRHKDQVGIVELGLPVLKDRGFALQVGDRPAVDGADHGTRALNVRLIRGPT